MLRSHLKKISSSANLICNLSFLRGKNLYLDLTYLGFPQFSTSVAVLLFLRWFHQIFEISILSFQFMQDSELSAKTVPTLNFHYNSASLKTRNYLDTPHFPLAVTTAFSKLRCFSLCSSNVACQRPQILRMFSSLIIHEKFYTVHARDLQQTLKLKIRHNQT